MAVVPGPGSSYPFSRQPLRWASPPGTAPGDRPGVVPPPFDPNAISGPTASLPVASLCSSTFTNRQTGVVGVAFPTLIRVATMSFNQTVIIMGVSLACSIINVSVTDVACVVVHKDVGANLSIDAASDFFAEHVVEQGLSHSIRTGTSFTDNIAPTFTNAEKMAIYALMLDAANAYTAVVSVRYLTTS